MEIRNNTCTGSFPKNEDYFIGRRLNDSAAIAVLCDGMGGLSFGDLAAQTVATTIGSYIEEMFTPESDFASLLEQAVLDADAALARLADEYHSKMGTALATVLVAGGSAYIAWLGNVRVYAISEDCSVDLLTSDHVASIGYGKTRLTRCIKGNHAIEPIPFTALPLEGIKSICLCTDGYYKMFEGATVKFDIDRCKDTKDDDASLVVINLQ